MKDHCNDLGVNFLDCVELQKWFLWANAFKTLVQDQDKTKLRSGESWTKMCMLGSFLDVECKTPKFRMQQLRQSLEL